jgi:uncharacterized delta-60 repeat protein
MDNQIKTDPRSVKLDPSFGTNGTLRLSKPGGMVSNAKKMISDQRGRILIAGTFKTQALEEYAIFRLTDRGEQDFTFGIAGVSVGSFKKNEDSRGNSVIITQDNKILLSGTSGDRMPGSGLSATVFIGGIACFDQNGVIDETFGTEKHKGHISLSITRSDDQKPIGQSHDGISDPVAPVLSSVEKNKIVFTWMGAGQSTDSGAYLAYSVLGRRESNGAEDTSFQKKGHIYIRYVAEQSALITWVRGHLVEDEKIIVAGSITYDDAPARGYLSRYDMSGKLDTAFGGGTQKDGFVLTPPLGEKTGGNIANILRHESTLLLVGNTDEKGVIAGFRLDGTVDQSFNRGELLYADLPGSKANVNWLDAASSDGGFIAMGYIGPAELGNFVIARYLTSGALDTRFGDGQGWVFSTLGVELKAILVQRRAGGLPNRILVTGVVTKGEYAVVMAFIDVNE